MINKLSCKLSNILGNSINSTDQEKEIYTYSIEVLLSLMLNIVILFETAYIIGKIPEFIVFIIFFSGLRTYAGGYHAKSHIECMTESLVIFFISAMSNSWFRSDGELFLAIGIVASIFLVFKYAPSESGNKPLSSNKQKKYKTISKNILILYCSTIIILYFYRVQTNYIFLTAVVAMLIESISLIIPENHSYSEL
ncbi:accessory gene regulator B [Sedimentibacter acidaminivorans]|jgi:accessory gene regulator B|uniref:Accessory gene regulator B n=1 Tax=Sedimentibacter acidaminivorans TaxID=913099 RepID=A0ABS4GE29_9FIRM|nr:accessory gene regulator B [Sedimentibacter acidaminivorans]